MGKNSDQLWAFLPDGRGREERHGGHGDEGDRLAELLVHGWVLPQSTFTGSWTKAAAVSPSFMAIAALMAGAAASSCRQT